MVSLVALRVAQLALLTWLAAGQMVIDKVYVSKGESTVSKSNNTVVLGGLFPVHDHLNDTCVISDLGIQTLEAMVLAVDNINKDPFLLPGVTFEFVCRTKRLIKLWSTSAQEDQIRKFLALQMGRPRCGYLGWLELPIVGRQNQSPGC